jgi:hypothetical protein
VGNAKWRRDELIEVIISVVVGVVEKGVLFGRWHETAMVRGGDFGRYHIMHNFLNGKVGR